MVFFGKNNKWKESNLKNFGVITNLNLVMLMNPNDLPFCNGFIQPINSCLAIQYKKK